VVILKGISWVLRSLVPALVEDVGKITRQTSEVFSEIAIVCRIVQNHIEVGTPPAPARLPISYTSVESTDGVYCRRSAAICQPYPIGDSLGEMRTLDFQRRERLLRTVPPSGGV